MYDVRSEVTKSRKRTAHVCEERLEIDIALATASCLPARRISVSCSDEFPSITLHYSLCLVTMSLTTIFSQSKLLFDARAVCLVYRTIKYKLMSHVLTPAYDNFY